MNPTAATPPGVAIHAQDIGLRCVRRGAGHSNHQQDTPRVSGAIRATAYPGFLDRAILLVTSIVYFPEINSRAGDTTLVYRLILAFACAAFLMPMASALDRSAPLEGVREMHSTVSSFLGTHRCVHDRQRVWCWGDNEFGQLGQGHTVDLSLATPVPDLPAFVQRITSLATGSRHTCAVTDLRLFCWGNNAAGQLGTGDFERRLRPTEIDLGQPVVRVGTGAQHTCAVDVIDRVFC